MEGEVTLDSEELRGARLPEGTLETVLREAPCPYRRLRLTSLSLPADKDWISILPTGLTHIQLSSVHISDTAAILPCLHSQFPSLSALDVSDNLLRLATSPEWLCGFPALTDLNLSGNPLGPEGVSVFSALLPLTSPHLHTLRLSKVCAVQDGLTSLLLAVSCARITSLDLSYNAFSGTGYQSVLAVLPILTRLKDLNLSGNCLNDDQVQGLLELREFLQFPETLQLDSNFTTRSEV